MLGYRGSYVTAYRNGDYGLFAFDSQYGHVRPLVRVGEPGLGLLHRAVRSVPRGHHRHRPPSTTSSGYSGTNASGDLYLVNSVWSRTTAPASCRTASTVEALAPQGEASSPATWSRQRRRRRRATDDDVWDVALGGGIVIAGGIGNTITATVCRRQRDQSAIALAPSVGLGGRAPPVDRQPGDRTTSIGAIRHRRPRRPVLADPGRRQLLLGQRRSRTSAPANIEQVMPCDGAGTGDLATGALDIGRFLDTSKNPDGGPTRRRRSRRSSATWRTPSNGQGASPRAAAGRGRPRRDHRADRPLAAGSEAQAPTAARTVSGGTHDPGSCSRSVSLGRTPVGRSAP